jgi:D-alanyl-D-alanine carboxypeptidase
MRFAVVLFLLFSIAFCAPPVAAADTPRGNPNIVFAGQRIDSMIATFMRDNEVQGLSLAIVQAPYITRAAGYGIADERRDTLVSVNTMFNIGDMRNAFTAVAAMQLVEDGKLQLSAVLPLVRNPAEHAALESLIENASGQTYEVFVRRRQLDTLRLQHTRFGRELIGGSGEVIRRGERHRKFLSDPALIDPSERAAGAGADGEPESRSIYSSASDISIWDIAFAGEILIKDAALRKLLYEPPGDQEGKRSASSGPWFFPGHPGLMIATGSDKGFSSLLARFTHRDELICVTLLANQEGLDLTQLAREIAGAYNNAIGPPEKALGMRAQQSPYSVVETMARLRLALLASGLSPSGSGEEGKLQGSFGQAIGWEAGGAVWVAVSDPAKTCSSCVSERKLRRAIDRALLEAIGAMGGTSRTGR